MNRLIALAAALFLSVSLAACGGKKPPDAAAYQGRKVLDTVRALAKTYQDKNAGGFMDEVAKDYPARDAFEASVKGVLGRFETVLFTFQNTKVLVLVPDRGSIKVEVNWDAEWRTNTGVMIKDGGRVTLVLDPKDFLLLAVEGRNPFVPVEKSNPAVRQPVQEQ